MWEFILTPLKRKQWGLAIVLVLSFTSYQEFPRVKHFLFYNFDDYAYKVVAYGLSVATNSDDIGSIVEEWKKNKWGAQIAALRVLCDNDEPRLVNIMSAQQKSKVCRMVQ